MFTLLYKKKITLGLSCARQNLDALLFSVNKILPSEAERSEYFSSARFKDNSHLPFLLWK